MLAAADILASFQRFYFDTALSASPAAQSEVFRQRGRGDQPWQMRGLCFRVSAWSDAANRQSERIDRSTTVDIKSPSA